MDSENKYLKKIKQLWSDKRTWGDRLVLACAVTGCFCFSFLFFGPLEMVAFNAESLLYGYREVALLLSCVAVLVFMGLTLILSVLKGKVFNYAISALFVIIVGGYFQGNFLNGEFGALTGDPLDWHLQKRALVGNLFVWFMILLLSSLVLYLSRKIWKKVITYVSVVLIVMQMVPCIGIFSGVYTETEDTPISGYWLSTEGMYEYSAEDNVLVFLLDRLDYDYIEEVLAYDPTFFDQLEGFVSYTNAISTYARTWPAANHLLTGYEEGAYFIPANEYFSDSWTAEGKHILRDLTRNGYTVDIYSEMSTMFGDGKFAEQYVDNVKTDRRQIDNVVMFKKMMYLSCYRYAPVALKPFFWADTNYYNADVFKEGGEITYDFYYIDEGRYSQGFTQLNTENQGKAFKFYHFFGPHNPFTLREDGTKSDVTTSSREQTMGSFSILYQIFDRMKELGIYDEATIIISADHGIPVSDYTSVQKPTRIGLFYKPAGSSKTALKYSEAQVSTQNIPATLVKATGGDYVRYGRPLDEIGEDEEIIRVYYKTALSEVTGREEILYVYNVVGDASDFDNWNIVETKEIKGPFY